VDIPRPEDIYLLCSDGLPKMVKDESIAEALRNETDLDAAAYRLIELANDAGGRDNITVVLVRVRERLKLEADLFSDGADDSGRAGPTRRANRNTAHAPVAGTKSGSLP
jgi:serine/threonine protein phosphatase PrpC